MSDIQEWAKDLKHNEKTANKYKGVKTVEDILRVAHRDGYTFTEKELLDFNLDMVAGGDGSGTTNNISLAEMQEQMKQMQAQLHQLTQPSNSGGSGNTMGNFVIGSNKSIDQTSDLTADISGSGNTSQIANNSKQDAKI